MLFWERFISYSIKSVNLFLQSAKLYKITFFCPINANKLSDNKLIGTVRPGA